MAIAGVHERGHRRCRRRLFGDALRLADLHANGNMAVALRRRPRSGLHAAPTLACRPAVCTPPVALHTVCTPPPRSAHRPRHLHAASAARRFAPLFARGPAVCTAPRIQRPALPPPCDAPPSCRRLRAGLGVACTGGDSSCKMRARTTTRAVGGRERQETETEGGPSSGSSRRRAVSSGKRAAVCRCPGLAPNAGSHLAGNGWLGCRACGACGRCVRWVAGSSERLR